MVGKERIIFNLVFPAEFQKSYISGFKPCEGLFAQLSRDKRVFDYKTKRQGITKRDIVLVYIHIYGEYEMPYTKNKVYSEEQLDIEVDHFYFLNKYNLL